MGEIIAVMISILSSIIAAFVVGFFTYRFGFKQFINERNRDEVTRYYLWEGLDKIIQSLDQAYFDCSFNYGQAIDAVDYVEKSLDNDVTGKRIVKRVLKTMRPVIVAPEGGTLYKLGNLTDNNEAVIKWVTETTGDYLKCGNYYLHEVYLQFQLYFNHTPNLSLEAKKAFLMELRKRIIDVYHRAMVLNEPLKEYLFRLRKVVDKKGIHNFKDFMEVANDPDVKSIIKEIEESYKKLVVKKQ